MGVQIGSDVIVGSNKNTYYYDTMTYDTKLKTKYKAEGTAGSELGIIHKLGDDGAYIESFKQVSSSPTDCQFRYVAGYNINTGDSAQTIPVSAAGQPGTAIVTCMGLVRDVETSEYYQCQISGLAQISGSWGWDLAADGEPASQTLDIEFVKKYSAKNLYDIIIWNEEDAQTIA